MYYRAGSRVKGEGGHNLHNTPVPCLVGVSQVVQILIATLAPLLSVCVVNTLELMLTAFVSHQAYFFNLIINFIVFYCWCERVWMCDCVAIEEALLG